MGEIEEDRRRIPHLFSILLFPNFIPRNQHGLEGHRADSGRRFPLIDPMESKRAKIHDDEMGPGDEKFAGAEWNPIKSAEFGQAFRFPKFVTLPTADAATAG